MTTESLLEPLLETKEGLKYKVYFRKQDGIHCRAYQSFCIDCGKEKYSSKIDTKRKLRCVKCSHRYLSTPERNAKIGNTLRNKYKTDIEWVKRVKAAKVVNSGENHWNWKGGITPITQKNRTSESTSARKLAVIMRDNYRCRICDSKDNIQAHHINSWSSFPEDRYILENGLTLCKQHHNDYHVYEREVRKNEYLSIQQKTEGPQCSKKSCC